VRPEIALKGDVVARKDLWGMKLHILLPFSEASRAFCSAMAENAAEFQ
jgi:hypothetical protein